VSSAGYGRYPDGPPDSRQTCPSENIKFYAWEVARPTSRGQTGWSEMSRPQTGISVLTDKDMPTTGRRKKNDCIRGTDSETLVGLDIIPEPGMRVMISTRGREQKANPPGHNCAGTIENVLQKGVRCVVLWDDGTGPYTYEISQAAGFQLMLLSPSQEPPKPRKRSPMTVILSRESARGAKGQQLQDFFHELADAGHNPEVCTQQPSAANAATAELAAMRAPMVHGNSRCGRRARSSMKRRRRRTPRGAQRSRYAAPVLWFSTRPLKPRWALRPSVQREAPFPKIGPGSATEGRSPGRLRQFARGGALKALVEYAAQARSPTVSSVRSHWAWRLQPQKRWQVRQGR